MGKERFRTRNMLELSKKLLLLAGRILTCTLGRVRKPIEWQQQPIHPLQNWMDQREGLAGASGTRPTSVPDALESRNDAEIRYEQSDTGTSRSKPVYLIMVTSKLEFGRENSKAYPEQS